MSLPGAEETEPITILEELHRNIIEPAVAQVTENNANENDERVHTLNIDSDQVSDVGKCNQLTESQSDVTDKVSTDNEQTVHSDKLCDSDRNDGFEILNFNLQTVEDTEIDDNLGQAEIKVEVKNIESKNSDDAVVDSSDIKSDTRDNAGQLLREASPPPVPLDTYRWEDVRRDKEKVRFEEVKNLFGLHNLRDAANQFCFTFTGWISLDVS